MSFKLSGITGLRKVIRIGGQSPLHVGVADSTLVGSVFWKADDSHNFIPTLSFQIKEIPPSPAQLGTSLSLQRDLQKGKSGTEPALQEHTNCIRLSFVHTLETQQGEASASIIRPHCFKLDT